MSYRLITTMLMAVAWAWAWPALASDTAEGQWWPQLSRELMANNPAIAAGRRKVEALSPIPASKMALSDPSLSASIMSVPVDSFRLDKEEMTQKVIEFRQDIPARSMRMANARMAQAAVELASAELAMDTAMAAMELKMAVNETIYLRRAMAILESTELLLDKFVRTALAKYSAGKGAQAEVILAQLERSKILPKKMKLEEGLELARVKINRLLGRSSGGAFAPPADYIPTRGTTDHARLYDTAKSHSPKIAMARAMAAEAQAALDEANASKSPMWMFSASYGQRDDTPEMARPDFVSVMAGVTIPLYKSSKQDRVIAGAVAGTLEKGERLREAETEVGAALASTLASLTQEERIIELYGSGLIPQAFQALESAMAAYQLDRTDYFFLINNQMNLLDMRMEMEMAIMRRADLYARLHSLTGMED